MSGVQSEVESIKSADIKQALWAYQAGTLGVSDGCLNDTEAHVDGSLLTVASERTKTFSCPVKKSTPWQGPAVHRSGVNWIVALQ